MVLHRDEPRPAIRAGHFLRLGELPGEHRRGADIARLARLHDVVQRLHRFLDRRGIVPAVDLVEIDIVHPQPRQAVVHRLHQRLARQTARIGGLLPGQESLGRDHNLVAPCEFGQQAPDHLFRGAARIHVRRIEEVDPRLHRLADEGTAFVLRKHPVAVPAFAGVAIAHAAEAQPRNLEARGPEIDVIHDRIPFQEQAGFRRASFRHRRVWSGRRYNRPAARQGTTPPRPCPAGCPSGRPVCAPPRLPRAARSRW